MTTTNFSKLTAPELTQLVEIRQALDLLIEAGVLSEDLADHEVAQWLRWYGLSVEDLQNA